MKPALEDMTAGIPVQEANGGTSLTTSIPP